MEGALKQEYKRAETSFKEKIRCITRPIIIVIGPKSKLPRDRLRKHVRWHPNYPANFSLLNSLYVNLPI